MLAVFLRCMFFEFLAFGIEVLVASSNQIDNRCGLVTSVRLGAGSIATSVITQRACPRSPYVAVRVNSRFRQPGLLPRPMP